MSETRRVIAYGLGGQYTYCVTRTGVLVEGFDGDGKLAYPDVEEAFAKWEAANLGPARYNGLWIDARRTAIRCLREDGWPLD